MKGSLGMLHLGKASFSPFRGLDVRHVTKNTSKVDILN